MLLKSKKFDLLLSNSVEVKMRKGKGVFLIHLIGFFILSFYFLWGFENPPRKSLGTAEELRQEIRLLNLVNGLELSPEQMERILKDARETKKIKEEFEQNLLSLGTDIEAVLQEIKAHLQENKEIPSQTVRHYQHLDTEIRSARAKMEERIKFLAQELEKSLQPHQLYQLEHFIPCIIPPKGESRIGQAGDSKAQVKNLERIRRIPSFAYERRKGQILEKTLENIKLHAPRGMEIDEQEMTKHIEDIYDRARNLEQTDFEIQKEKLADELFAFSKPPDFSNMAIKKIEFFLLSPAIIPILEERI